MHINWYQSQLSISRKGLHIEGLIRKAELSVVECGRQDIGSQGSAMIETWGIIGCPSLALSSMRYTVEDLVARFLLAARLKRRFLKSLGAYRNNPSIKFPNTGTEF